TGSDWHAARSHSLYQINNSMHIDDPLRATSDSGDLLQRLDQLVEIGVALSSERDIDKLLESILVAAKSITNADGGTLYRMQEGRSLKFEIVRNDTLGVAMGGTSGVPIPFYPVSLYDAQGKPVHSMVAP